MTDVRVPHAVSEREMSTRRERRAGLSWGERTLNWAVVSHAWRKGTGERLQSGPRC